jgi:hypothetical protein
MNSWKSIELSACAPPLMTFSIGTGSTCASAPTEVAVERDGPSSSRSAAFATGERDAEDRVRAEAALVRRAVESISSAVDEALVACVEFRATAVGQLAVHVRDRSRDALATPVGAAVAELDGLVRTGRRARGRRMRGRRPSRATSTSTVGLPRESSTWRP